MINKQKWTESDVAYLKENYGITPKAEMAKKLNRTVQAINFKAHYIGLRMPLTDYEFYKGGEVVAFGTKPECAEQLGLSRATINHYVTSRRQKEAKYKDILYGVRVDD